MDIQQLADEGLETCAKYLRCINAILDKEDSVSFDGDGPALVMGDKERVVAIKAGTEILKTVFDRTFPKLSSSKNTNVDVDFAKLLAAKFPPQLLLQMQEYMDNQEPKHVESESRPCPE